MVERLDLNLEEFVNYRGFVLSSIRDNVRRRRKAHVTIAALDQILSSNPDPTQEAAVRADRVRLLACLREPEANLRLLLSTEDLPAPGLLLPEDVPLVSFIVHH